MKKTSVILNIVLAAFMISACGASGGSSDERQFAQDIAEEYLESIGDGDIDYALDFYSPELFRQGSRGQLHDVLTTAHKQLGGLESLELVKLNVKKDSGGPLGSGTYYEMRYRVSYANYITDERLKLFEPEGDGDTTIFEHRITSSEMRNAEGAIE